MTLKHRPIWRYFALALAATGIGSAAIAALPASPASAAGAPKLERLLGWVERNNDVDDEYRVDLVVRVPHGEKPTSVQYDWNLDGTLDTTASLATGPGSGQQYQIVSTTQDGTDDLLVLTVRGDADYEVTCTTQPQTKSNFLRITVPSGQIDVTGFTTTIYNYDACSETSSRPFVRIPWDNGWGSPAGTSQGGWGAITSGSLPANLAIIDADNPNSGGLNANCGITDSVSYQWYKETSPGGFSPVGTMTTSAVTSHHASTSGALLLPAQSFSSPGYYKLLAWPNAKSSAGGADCSARTYTAGNTSEAFVVGSVFNDFNPLFVDASGTFASGTEGAPYSSTAPTASGGDGGPFTWSTSSPLPAGLTLDPSTGVVSGTPSTGSAGVYPITLVATDGSGNSASFTANLVVDPPDGAPIVDGRIGLAAALCVLGVAGLRLRPRRAAAS